ncbi:MAG: response regulator [Desulfamplus sp.]|nr:response regulator [Desulfamplus sp.]
MNKFNQKKPLILIVDDEVVNIEILREIVENSCEVIATKSPLKAIELSEKFQPDLILLDIMMPEMDGWEVCRKLRSNPKTARIGIFFVTAKTDPADRIKSFQAGAQDYITKPLLALEVQARVRGYLARKQEENCLRQQLEQARKMEAIGTLAGGILHDINNILTPIFGYLQILMNNIDGKDNAMLGKIYLCAQRLAELSRQILNFSRQNEHKKEVLRLKIQIKEIVKLLKIAFPKSIVFSLSIADKPLKIKADLTAIHQVVINLCVNAVHAMNGKGILKIVLDEVNLPSDMKVSTPPDPNNGHALLLGTTKNESLMSTDSSKNYHINHSRTKGETPAGSLTVQPPDNLTVQSTDKQESNELAVKDQDELIEQTYVKLTVEDNGCGMDSHMLSKIFEPFYTTKKIGEGTGLGLTTVKSIMEEHQGKIVVESQTGKGSAFHLFFPSTDHGQKKSEYPQIKMERGTESVLIVDDEKDIVESISTALSEAGYQTIATTRSDDVVDLFSSNKVDIVVMDIDMQGLNGIEVAQKLRKITPCIPVVFCPGYQLQEHDELTKGLYNYLLYKPFNPQDLCRLIRKALA